MKKVLSALMAISLIFTFASCDLDDFTSSTELNPSSFSSSETVSVTSTPAVSSKALVTSTPAVSSEAPVTSTPAVSSKAPVTSTPATVTSAPTVITPAPNPEVMVWIPKSGKKYHSYSGCSNMKNPSQVTKSEAIHRGYGPCSKCY